MWTLTKETGKKPQIFLRCPTCGYGRMSAWRTPSERHGQCRPCSQRIAKNRPEIKARISALARRQVLRQGGIPNAVHSNVGKRGAQHPNWKGGITKPNKLARTAQAYIDWRLAVFERDNYTCVFCRGRGVHLHADHIKPFSIFPELRLSIENGRTLCKRCHATTPTFCKKWKTKIEYEISIGWNPT